MLSKRWLIAWSVSLALACLTAYLIGPAIRQSLSGDTIASVFFVMWGLSFAAIGIWVSGMAGDIGPTRRNRNGYEGGRMKTPTASKIIEEQSSPASIHEVQKLIECERKRRLIEIADMWEGIEVYKHPTTIQIRVKEEQGYSVIVEKHNEKNRLNPSRTLYDCEEATSLFDRLVDVLDLSNEIEIQAKVKED